MTETESRPYRRVAALVRFDAFDARVVGKALLIARQNGAALDVLHLIEPDGLLDGGSPVGEARAYEQAAERRLAFLAASLGVEEASCHAFFGPCRERLNRYVESAGPDLIVTGEPNRCLPGYCDTLILSPGRASRGRGLWHGLRARVTAWLGVPPCIRT